MLQGSGAYRLAEANGDRTIFIDAVTATWHEDFPVLRGGDRVRGATELAIRKNLRTFLDHLESKPPAATAEPPDTTPDDPGA